MNSIPSSRVRQVTAPPSGDQTFARFMLTLIRPWLTENDEWRGWYLSLPPDERFHVLTAHLDECDPYFNLIDRGA